MLRLDLRSEHIGAWRAKLTPDLVSAVPDDAAPDGDAAAEEFAAQMLTASPRTISVLIRDNSKVVSRLGRARRLRLLCWAMNQAWPDAAILIREILDDESDSGGEGQVPIAPLFRADLEGILGVCMARNVQGIADRRNVEAIASGTREYEAAMDLSRRGGM